MSEQRGRWVPVLLLESNTTPTQRARNYALYLRLRDGIPVDERKTSRDGVGLHLFQFEVPIRSCTYWDGAGEPSYMFRLDKDGECYRRLLSYITDHFPDDCDADTEVERLRAIARDAIEIGQRHTRALRAIMPKADRVAADDERLTELQAALSPSEAP